MSAITGELIKKFIGHHGVIRSVAFTSDGTRVLSGSDTTIRLWNVATRKPIGEPVTSIAVSPDDTLIASASEDSTVRLWDVKTGAPIGLPLEGHSAMVLSVAFSPDGTKIASGSNDNIIRVWNTTIRAPISTSLNGHTAQVRSVAFSHDGAFIVSGSYDTTIRVWNVETGIEVGEPLRGHTEPAMSVACSPDGVHVVSGSLDQSVRLWDIGDILAKGVTGQKHDNSAKLDVPSPGNTAVETSPVTENCTMLHPDADVNTQYPHHLFPPQTFNIRDGWILGPNEELLLRVPPANRTDPLSPDSRSRILGAHPTKLYFSNFNCGTEWAQCHELIVTRC